MFSHSLRALSHLIDIIRCFTEWKAGEVTTTGDSYFVWIAFSLKLIVLHEEVITVFTGIDQ